MVALSLHVNDVKFVHIQNSSVPDCGILELIKANKVLFIIIGLFDQVPFRVPHVTTESGMLWFSFICHFSELVPEFVNSKNATAGVCPWQLTFFEFPVSDELK